MIRHTSFCFILNRDILSCLSSSDSKQYLLNLLFGQPVIIVDKKLNICSQISPFHLQFDKILVSDHLNHIIAKNSKRSCTIKLFPLPLFLCHGIFEISLSQRLKTWNLFLASAEFVHLEIARQSFSKSNLDQNTFTDCSLRSCYIDYISERQWHGVFSLLK